MRLTERDFDLLRYLAEQGVASSRQLADKFFPSVRAFYARIGALLEQNLIESVPITKLMEVSRWNYFTTATDLLGASRIDVQKYRIYRLGERFKKKWPSTGKLSDVKMWRHQLMVNELRRVFEKRFPGALFLNDPQITEEWRWLQNWGPKSLRDITIPDLTVRVKDFRIAIEIERHRKTETAYHMRFLDYEKSDYTHVLYYCESELVFKTVSKIAGGLAWVAVARFGTIHEVYRSREGWARLEDFLAERNQNSKRR